jgi:ethanolamine ammonia-lyase small subunit
MTTPDPWMALRAHTLARIALGRTGASLPTAEWLRFAEAHALARDAVHTPLDVAALVAALRHHGVEPAVVASAAPDRATYLRRPDLGRRLDAASAAALAPGPGGLAVVLADGLSARATQSHALPLLLALRAHLEAAGEALGTVAVATQARVALGDEVGERVQAGAVLVLIGERPGLSSPDSLGAYLTWAPRRGRRDAERNCVSNIRPEGQPPAQAAARLAWLLGAARRLGATGVALKDESDVAPPAVVIGGERRDAPALPGQSAA